MPGLLWDARISKNFAASIAFAPILWSFRSDLHGLYRDAVQPYDRVHLRVYVSVGHFEALSKIQVVHRIQHSDPNANPGSGSARGMPRGVRGGLTRRAGKDEVRYRRGRAETKRGRGERLWSRACCAISRGESGGQPSRPLGEPGLGSGLCRTAKALVANLAACCEV